MKRRHKKCKNHSPSRPNQKTTCSKPKSQTSQMPNEYVYNQKDQDWLACTHSVIDSLWTFVSNARLLQILKCMNITLHVMPFLAYRLPKTVYQTLPTHSPTLMQSIRDKANSRHARPCCKSLLQFKWHYIQNTDACRWIRIWRPGLRHQNHNNA